VCFNATALSVAISDGNGSAGSNNVIVLSPGVFRHVALTWDKVNAEAYIDANPVVAVTGALSFTSQDLVIGADLDNNMVAAPFVGLIDDLRFYDRTLSVDEIHQLASQ